MLGQTVKHLTTVACVAATILTGIALTLGWWA